MIRVIDERLVKDPVSMPQLPFCTKVGGALYLHYLATSDCIETIRLTGHVMNVDVIYGTVRDILDDVRKHGGNVVEIEVKVMRVVPFPNQI